MNENITPEGSVAPVYLEPREPEEFVESDQTIDQLRQAAYQATADPIYMKWQRGEATEQDWLDAVQAVKNLYPRPN